MKFLSMYEMLEKLNSIEEKPELHRNIMLEISKPPVDIKIKNIKAKGKMQKYYDARGSQMSRLHCVLSFDF